MDYSAETLIEDLVAEAPDAVSFLMDRKIRCLACGEPIWGTLGQAAAEKGIAGEALTTLIRDLNSFLERSDAERNHTTERNHT